MSNPYLEALDPLADCQIEALPEIYWRYFGEKKDGYFVEAGAFDGIHWSNTQPLITLGWNGLLIEPHPVYFDQCQKRYQDNPRINVLKTGVGCYNGPGILFTGGSLSTLEAQTVEAYRHIPTLGGTGLTGETFERCQVATLNVLLDVYCDRPRLDVLSLDVEGGEVAALAGLNLSRWMPMLAIVETHEKFPDVRLSWKAGAVDTFFLPHGYEKIHADTINTIYYHA